MRETYELLHGARRQQSNRTTRRRIGGSHTPPALTLDYHNIPTTNLRVGDKVKISGFPVSPMRVWKIEDGKIFTTGTHKGNDVQCVTTPTACIKV